MIKNFFDGPNKEFEAEKEMERIRLQVIEELKKMKELRKKLDEKKIKELHSKKA